MCVGVHVHVPMCVCAPAHSTTYLCRTASLWLLHCMAASCGSSGHGSSSCGSGVRLVQGFKRKLDGSGHLRAPGGRRSGAGNRGKSGQGLGLVVWAQWFGPKGLGLEMPGSGFPVFETTGI